MSSRINLKQNEHPIYDIVIEKDFSRLLKELEPFSISNKKICIVSDSNTSVHYGDVIKTILSDHTKEVIQYTFPAGESSKNLDTVKKLYSVLIDAKFDRKDILIALGGGVTGDLTGFVAATYLRGIDYIQIPTSLLSQVDSSIGGKTGVDFDQYKNMVGSFYHPSLVFINLSVLKTLPEREFYSGMGEVIKHGLIKDKDYYKWLKENSGKIKSLEMDILEKMVVRSCFIKKEVVEKDFHEKGDRALLNFGHTIGHAVEKLMDFSLLHGECVSIGMKYALKLSVSAGYITPLEEAEITELLESFHLPVDYSGLKKDDLLNTVLMDKKMESGTLKFILLRDVGNAVIDRTISLQQLEDLLP